MNKVYIIVKMSTINVFDNHSNRGRFHSSPHCVDVATAAQEEQPHATAVFAIFSSSRRLAFHLRVPPMHHACVNLVVLVLDAEYLPNMLLLI